MNSLGTVNLVSILKRPQIPAVVSDAAVEPTESESTGLAATRPTKVAKSSHPDAGPKHIATDHQDHMKLGMDDPTV